MFARDHRYQRVAVHAAPYADGDVVRHHIPGRTSRGGHAMQPLGAEAAEGAPTATKGTATAADTDNLLVRLDPDPPNDTWDLRDWRQWLTAPDVLANELFYTPAHARWGAGCILGGFDYVAEGFARFFALVAVFVYTVVQIATWLACAIAVLVAYLITTVFSGWCGGPNASMPSLRHPTTYFVLCSIHLLALVGHAISFAVVARGNGLDPQPVFFVAPTLAADCAVEQDEVRWNDGVGLQPVLKRSADGFDLKAHVVWFFVISLGAHAIYLVMLLWGGKKGTYMGLIGACNQPLRWIEYAFSSAVMIRALTYVSGLHDSNILDANFVLLVTTNMFGVASEALNPPARSGANEAETRSVDAQSLEGDPWARRTWRSRLLVNLLGYVPFVYACVGGIVQPFERATEGCVDDWDGASQPDAVPCPQRWVNVIIYATLCLFCSFGVASIAVLSTNKNVRKRYAGAEMSYAVLSLVSKLTLGWSIYVNVLQRGGSLGNSVLEIEDDTTDATFVQQVWNARCAVADAIDGAR